jgi:hypothetical protein
LGHRPVAGGIKVNSPAPGVSRSLLKKAVQLRVGSAGR